MDICGPAAATDYPQAPPDELKETVRLVEALDRRAVSAQAESGISKLSRNWSRRRWTSSAGSM
jgi:hypothetical protein